MKRLLNLTIALLAVNISMSVDAQQISPAMIEQLKSLPKSQQVALAKQYGVDLQALQLDSASSTMTLAMPGQPLTQNQQIESQVLEEGLVNVEVEDEVDPSQTRYGLALFDQSVSTFAPTDNSQVSDNYILGVGDEINVQLFGTDNQSLTLTVNREGEINFPQLGPIRLIGLSLKDSTTLIQERIKNQLIGVNAVISMGRLRAINIFMAGEVNVPGAYSVSSLTTISQALFQAGGISDIGSLRNVQVKRNGQIVTSFDVYELLMQGSSVNDIRLRSGDVVFVPTYQNVISVQGEVKRPMFYELTPGQTVADALTMAGGLKSSALSSQLVLVQRPVQSNLPYAKNIDVDNPDHMDIQLNDGDIINVMMMSDLVNNSVSIKGAVAREGQYGWQKGLRISDLISDIRRDVTRTADLQYALIIREKNTNLDIDVIQFSIVDALTNKGSSKDPVLQANDQVLIFDYVALTQLDEDINENSLQGEEITTQNVSQDEGPDFSRQALLAPVVEKLKAQAREGEPVKLVSISGAVKAPGEYPLGKGYTIADLVLAAGGLNDSAYLQSIELRQVKEQANGDITVNYQNIDISSAAKMQSVSLQSRDHVNVRENTQWNPADTIVLEGEVRFPGTYLIQPGETISQVLARAGGLTNEAFAEAAVFTREEIAKQETLQAKLFADSVRRDYATSVLTEETINASYAEIQAVTQQLENFEGQGRLLIDLPKAMSGNTSSDVEVVDGDKLVIPKRNTTVTIVGEVKRQGTHGFQSDLSLDEYLRLSAGTTKRADESGIYIIKANGSVVIPDTSLTSFASVRTNIEAGDTIVVPVNAEYKDSIPLWRDITQIIYQGTVAIAAIARL
jgi:polysaccharide export outer membrane protein